MGVIRYKILRDLWGFKGRTIQIVLIIGIGAAALGMIVATRNMMIPSMQEMWTRTNPSMIYLFVGPPVSDDDLRLLRKVPGVTDIEGLSSEIIEWRVSPDQDWRSGTLVARVDYPNQRLDMIELMKGDWPEDERLAIENADDIVFGAESGKRKTGPATAFVNQSSIFDSIKNRLSAVFNGKYKTGRELAQLPAGIHERW